MKSTYLFGAALCALAGASAATAATQSGVSGDLAWEAHSTIIGATPTSDAATGGGGNALFFPAANKSGTVALIMTYSNGDRFICSGSLSTNRMSIVTAGHCVSKGGVKDPTLVSTTAYFYDGNPNVRTPFGPGVAINIARYDVNPNYTGEVIDQNDIAVLRLATAAPASAVGYDMYYGGDLKYKTFNVAGYGQRSTVGGSQGNIGAAAAQTGFLREGDNRYEWRFGDPLFQGVWTSILGGTADYSYSYVSDFDNGLTANDTARRTANALGLGNLGNANWNNTGLGAREVTIAGGDSGGPGFIDGQLASVNSYGLSFGTAYGDVRAGLNDTFGEFQGYVPIFIHRDFLNASFVPEPASWALMIGGFGMIGGALRRQRKTVAA